MEMFLMALCLSMFGLAVSAIAFGAATRPAPPPPAQPELRPAKALSAARFFANPIAALPSQPAHPVPTEVLLAKIEQHVRLERAAAQCFLESPSHAQLHTKTTSQLVN